MAKQDIYDQWPQSKLIVTGRTRALVLDYIQPLRGLKEPNGKLYLRLDLIVPIDEYYDYGERRAKWGTDFPGEIVSVADHHAKLHVTFETPSPIVPVIEALARRHPLLRFTYYVETGVGGATLTLYARDGRIVKEVRGTAPKRKQKRPPQPAAGDDDDGAPVRADRPPDGWPAYVMLGNACLRFKDGRYYRDAGDWSVGAVMRVDEGKLYTVGDGRGLLGDEELKPTDYWTWRQNNGHWATGGRRVPR